MKKIIFTMLAVMSFNAFAHDMRQCFFEEKPEAKEYGFKFQFNKKQEAVKFAKKLEQKETVSKVVGKYVLVSHPTREESSEDCFIAIKEAGLIKIKKTFVK